MSQNNSCVLLKKVKPYNTKWRVQVKVIHSWKQTYADETLEMVLVDETGVKMLASCNKANMFRTQRNLPIGQWRVIEKFKVSKAGGNYRTTNEQYKITILNDTVFSASDYKDDRSFLSLANYQEVSSGKLDDKFLIDILGQFYDVSEVRIFQVKNEERKRIQFRMRDNSGNSLACCLWGPYAEKMENHLQNPNEKNQVCLLRFAKINSFRGEIQISNAFDASVLDLNPTMAEAVAFRDQMQDDPLPLALPDKKREKKEIILDDWDDVGITMIRDLFEDSEMLKTKIVCSVEAIDTDWAWYYIGCNRCNHGVTMLPVKGKIPEKPLFRCPKCRVNVSNVEAKYKLHLIVQDDTATCKIMLLGSVAKAIIGSEAVDLWDGSFEEIDDPENLPAPIWDLIGKSFCFGVTTSSDGTDIFKVSEVWSGDIIQKVESHSEPLTQIEGGSSSVSSAGVLLIKGDSQPISDCSTPLSKRKETDADLPDISSASKKICQAPIKLEKTKSE